MDTGFLFLSSKWMLNWVKEKSPTRGKFVSFVGGGNGEKQFLNINNRGKHTQNRKHMKILMIFILVCFFTIFGNAQNNNDKKVLIIDTLTGVDDLNYFDVRICLDTNEKMHIKDTFINPSLFKNGDFYTATIMVNKSYKNDFFPVEKEVEGIDLLFDREQGYVSLRNLWQTDADTIIISKWNVCSNNIPDIKYRLTVFEKMVNDSLISSYDKIDTILIRKRAKESRKIESFFVKINNVNYKVDLNSFIMDVRGSFDGGNPSKLYREYLNNRKTNKKYRYTRFSGSYFLDKTYLEGKVYIQILNK